MPLTLAIIMQCGVMKKGNCAEGYRTSERRRASQQTIPAICLLLIGNQRYVFLHLHCLFLMATLSTSQMNAWRNEESSSIMWPTALQRCGKEERNAHLEVVESSAIEVSDQCVVCCSRKIKSAPKQQPSHPSSTKECYSVVFQTHIRPGFCL